MIERPRQAWFIVRVVKIIDAYSKMRRGIKKTARKQAPRVEVRSPVVPEEDSTGDETTDSPCKFAKEDEGNEEPTTNLVNVAKTDFIPSCGATGSGAASVAVSYTHLTLPTKRIV